MSQRSDIKVEVQGIPANSWGELMQAISVNIAGGDVPDIADIASEGQRSFAASGIIIPIDEYLERDKEEMKETLDEIDPALMETMKYDGKTYCLPTVWNNILLYYNKNVLERFNIPEPESGWTIAGYWNEEGGWKVLMKRAMECDNSWGKSANEYIRLYRAMLKE